MDYPFSKSFRKLVLGTSGIALLVAAIHWLVLHQDRVAAAFWGLFAALFVVWVYEGFTPCARLHGRILHMSKGIFHQIIAPFLDQEMIELREVAHVYLEGSRLILEMKDGKKKRRPLYTLSSESLFSLLTALRLVIVKMPSQPQHFLRVQAAMQTGTTRLVLLNASVIGQMVGLTFTWIGEMSEEDMDATDTKVRAFINCAIADLAVAIGIPCREGSSGVSLRIGNTSTPIPGWFLAERPQPTLVAQSEFDVAARRLFVIIGTPTSFACTTDSVAAAISHAAVELLHEIVV